jgi:exopolyphosphatase / guanosine-5'-triphosphate,3'-diphosphate pyrophosphatase
MAERIGIVDMGSGTARLVVYQYEPGRWFKLTDEIREPVRLGEGFASSGELDKNAIERALDALKLYADYAGATKLGRLEVIATSAVREAANSQDFLSRTEGLNLEFQVLSGEDEARYGALAVANSFIFPNCWVMDLGGGSAQLSKLENRWFVRGLAYPLGGVRLTEQFLKGDKASPKEISALEKHVKTQMGVQLERVKAEKAPLVAMGGTIRNLARAVQKASNYPFDMIHGYFLKRDALEEVIEKLVKLEKGERSLPGIHPDRADVILAGALVYRTVLRETHLEGIHISGQGVREGAFYRHFLPEPHLMPEVRSMAARNLFAQYPQPEAHTDNVRKLTRKLFDGLEALHRYGSSEALLLDAAAYLHDIGMAVNYFDHHKHSAYLILNSQMPGLSHREHVMLALLTQYHRKGDPKLGEFKSILEPDDDKRLLRLSACLRLAEYLERARAGRVTDLVIEIAKDTVKINLIASEVPRVELVEASKQAGLFEKAFDRKLELIAEDLHHLSRRSTPGAKTKRKNA